MSSTSYFVSKFWTFLSFWAYRSVMNYNKLLSLHGFYVIDMLQVACVVKKKKLQLVLLGYSRVVFQINEIR